MSDKYILSRWAKLIDASGKTWFKQQIAYLNSTHEIEMIYIVEPTFRKLCDEVVKVTTVLDKGLLLTKEDCEELQDTNGDEDETADVQSDAS